MCLSLKLRLLAKTLTLTPILVIRGAGVQRTWSENVADGMQYRQREGAYRRFWTFFSNLQIQGRFNLSLKDMFILKIAEVTDGLNGMIPAEKRL